MLKRMVVHVKDDTSANGVKSCSSAQHKMKMEITVLESSVLIDWRLQLRSEADWRRMGNHSRLSVRKSLLHQNLVRSLSIPKENHRETSSDWYRSMSDRSFDLGLDMLGAMMCPPAGHGADFRVFREGCVACTQPVLVSYVSSLVIDHYSDKTRRKTTTYIQDGAHVIKTW